MSTYKRYMTILCNVAHCERCDVPHVQEGHKIEILYIDTSDSVKVMIDGIERLCVNDEVFDAICELHNNDGLKRRQHAE